MNRSTTGGRGIRVIGGMAVAAAALAFLGLQSTRSPMAEASQAQPELNPAPIDGARAYGYLKAICDIGPRPAGSEANAKQRQMVAEHFRKMGAEVREQPFTSRHPLTSEKVEMANLIGSWFPDRPDRIVIGAHYDTRPFPDEETDPRLRRQPFIGANDGASGVALLMEMANHLKDSPTPWGVDLVLFDGEELVYGRSTSRRGEYFLGSEAFADAYRKRSREEKQANRYAGGMVLDMVGGKDLDLPVEPYSFRFAPDLVRDVWNVAEALHAPAFRKALGQTEVMDDHLALNKVGIPTIDIIDFGYPQWHTAGDLPEQCAPESLAQVGRVVTAWLNKPRPKRSR